MRRRQREVAYADHVPIFEAVEKGDTQAARDATSAHMEGASQRLMEALEQREEARGPAPRLPDPALCPTHRQSG